MIKMIDGWIDGYDVWMNGYDEWMDGMMDGWYNRKMDR